MGSIPPPNPRQLLPPFLACLPIAFMSTKPPPALFPSLSPLLRQRLHLLTSGPSARPDESTNWLRLLTYNHADKLIELVQNMHLEPHPVSGELELFEENDPQITYRRLDMETLQAKCGLDEHGITVIWVWCEADRGGTGIEALEGVFNGGNASESAIQVPVDGWKVAQVVPSNDMDDQEEWQPSIAEAESIAPTAAPAENADSAQQTVNEEDDYWASYDRAPPTPGRTPTKHSPAPGRHGGLAPLTTLDQQTSCDSRKPSVDESEYYARYGTEVQPAMDGHDPDEEEPDMESTLQNNQGAQHSLLNDTQNLSLNDDPVHQHQLGVAATEYASFLHGPRSSSLEYAHRLHPTLSTDRKDGEQTEIPLHSPSPTRPSTDTSLNKMEEKSFMSSVEHGVKNHISTEIKSLYRLACSMGIEKEDFERTVRTELDLLDMLEF